MNKRIGWKSAIGMALVLLLSGVCTIQEAEAAALQERSKQDIVSNYYNKNWFDFETYSDPVQYEREPNFGKSFDAGKPKQKYLDEALNAVNFTRFLVGLPDDITINTEYNTLAQHASAVNAMNDDLTHYPDQPAGMPDEAYALGRKGAGSSNIGVGYASIKDSIIMGYMEDEDPGNIDRVGHRRWILNPSMQRIGFGYASNYTATYVFDLNREEEIAYDFIAWPARGYMPIEYINASTPWSISLGEDYDSPQPDKVKVSIRNTATGSTWVFDRNSNRNADLSESKDYFTVNDEGYGIDKTIIFRPKIGEITYQADDVFEVAVSGITIKGVESPIRYRVQFFALTDVPSGWAADEIQEAVALGLVPEHLQSRYAANITRYDFSTLIMNFLEQKTGKTVDVLLSESGKKLNADAFTDTKDPTILAANAFGIVTGKGEGRFDPDGHITRQEAAVMLKRAADALGIDTTGRAASFADHASIASWAVDAVQFVASASDKQTGSKIMGGVGGGRFDPKGPYTRQQAYITVKRLFQYITD